MTKMWTHLASTLAISFMLNPIFATAQELVDPISKDNSPNCDCFLVSGPDLSYFQYHRFWDFRNIADDTNGDDYTVAPPLVTAEEDAKLKPVTSSFLNTTKWGLDWQIQTWRSNATTDSPVTSVNSAQNIFISRNTSSPDKSTYLTLRASRLPDFMSISEFDSLQTNILHSSIRARMRVIPNALSTKAAPSASNVDIGTDAGSTSDHPVDFGAVAGFFTFYSGTQESDIEILTRDPIDRIRYSNQPDYNFHTGNTVPGASTDLAMPNTFDWTNWLEHRIDWHPGLSRWYINDQLLLKKAKNVPSHPSGLIVNLWGDGGEWSGNMTVGGQVQFAIEWIEMVFNVSGPLYANHEAKRDVKSLFERTPELCHVGCTVDGVAQVGFPEQVFNSTSSSGANSIRNRGFDIGVYTTGAMVTLAILCIWSL
jgi:hypothetical protein